MTERFLLRLDHADGLLIDKENVVGRAGIGGIFTDGDTGTGREVDFRFVLHDPTRGGEQAVDAVAGGLLGVLVGQAYDGLKSAERGEVGKPFAGWVTMRLT